MSENTIFTLADQLKILRDEKKQREEQLKQLNTQIDQLDQALVERMTEEETQSFTRSGQLFFLRTTTRASAKAGEQPQLYQWLKANGYGDLVKETVNAQTLNGWAREILEENDDQLPEDLAELVNIFEKTTVAIRKA